MVEARNQSRQLFEIENSNTWDKVKGRLWAAYNGVTEYIDYSRGARMPARQLGSIWFGTGYLTKARAYRVAMANVEAWKN